MRTNFWVPSSDFLRFFNLYDKSPSIKCRNTVYFTWSCFFTFRILPRDMAEGYSDTGRAQWDVSQGEPKMADFADTSRDDVALLSGNGCCRVDRIACAGVENRGKKRNSTKRCGLDRLNLIYAKRAVARPPNGLIRYPRLTEVHPYYIRICTFIFRPFTAEK